ncbi:MAG: aminotransferase class V-fold PLP-dependent enzyme [Nocardioidaceae bacterium]
MQTAKAIRADFDLDPEIRYLNHGGFGLVPRPVVAERDRWRRVIDNDPMRFFSLHARDEVAAARSSVTKFFGVPDESGAFVRNVSEGVSTVLAVLGLREGDEIVHANHGYGAVRCAAEHWCGRTGARVIEATFPIGADNDAVVQAFGDAVSDKTKLVIVDQITSPTATVLPVRAIAAAVGDTTVLVDAAHVPGTLPTTIDQLGVDLWVGNVHKWMFTPRGAAMLWASKRWRDRLSPLVLSWGLPLGFPRSFDTPGTIDLSGWLAVPAGLDYWRGLGGWEQTDRNAALVEKGQSFVAEALATDLAGLPADPAPTMRLVPLPDGVAATPEDADAFQHRLAEDGHVVAPAIAFGERGYLRIAAQGYNDESDYERLAEVLVTIVR